MVRHLFVSNINFRSWIGAQCMVVYSPQTVRCCRRTFCRILLTLVDEVLVQALASCGEPQVSENLVVAKAARAADLTGRDRRSLPMIQPPTPTFWIPTE